VPVVLLQVSEKLAEKFAQQMSGMQITDAGDDDDLDKHMRTATESRDIFGGLVSCLPFRVLGASSV
jgi:hypothetical protein